MPRYVVLESDIETKSQKVRVMRDGFAVLAIGFPVPWLIFHRLWFEAILLLPLVMAISLFSGNPETMGIVLVGNLTLGLLVAIEGAGRIIARLKRRGYREIGTVAEAQNYEEAEFHAAELMARVPSTKKKEAPKPDADTDMILGLA